MDKGNDTDSSSMTNQDLDEMIVVKKKRRNRIKNNVSQTPGTATHSRSLPDSKSPRWDKQRQKINTDAKLKPLKISTASFDMDQDFPPLRSHPVSASNRREKIQSSDKLQVHPSKSDGDLPTPTNIKKAFEEENTSSIEDGTPMASESLSNEVYVVVANENKEKEKKEDAHLRQEHEEAMENLSHRSEMQCETEDGEQPAIINNIHHDISNEERRGNVTGQHLYQPGPSYGRKKERRNHRSHSHNNFTSQSYSQPNHRPRILNSNIGARIPPHYYNYGYMNPPMNPPYVSPTQTPSGYPMYYSSGSNHSYHNAYAHLQSLPSHPPTRFTPQQTFLPMQMQFPYPTSATERFQGPSFYQQHPMHTNVAPIPGISRSSVYSSVSASSSASANEKTGERENTVEMSPATTPVADYNGHRPPSIPATISGIQTPSSSLVQNRPFVENNYDNHIHPPGFSAPPGMGRSFGIPTSMPLSVSQISVTDSTMVRMADSNNSPLSRSPDSITSSHPATTTGSSNSDP
uniref:Uncharacterized protein n=1 Tax=Panagrolaimus sp. PS1159 TaxID=55785 RepID=A0AC35GD43_9BILA